MFLLFPFRFGAPVVAAIASMTVSVVGMTGNVAVECCSADIETNKTSCDVLIEEITENLP